MPTDGKSTTLTLHLVDSAKGHVVQTWRFEGSTRVVIGRSPECDVRLTDKSVSRVHVEFVLDPESMQWVLHSHGRNGTLIGGEMVTEFRPKDRTLMQLGPNGPKFQLSFVHENLALAATVTGDTDTVTLEFLTIDQKRKNEEVSRIAEGDAFRSLIERAKQLKRQKNDAAP